MRSEASAKEYDQIGNLFGRQCGKQRSFPTTSDWSKRQGEFGPAQLAARAPTDVPPARASRSRQAEPGPGAGRLAKPALAGSEQDNFMSHFGVSEN